MPVDRDPLWYQHAIFYQLHVRAFQDSDGDGIGDFQGLTSRLDYLQDLGVTALWLLPFYPSPLRDDGYDIADYTDVNARYGNLADFKAFVAAAHDRGLRVVTELVLNHTSDQHEWFQKSRRARKGSKWRDFYVWSDTTDRYKEARIIFKDFEPSNWTWDEVAGQYYWHRFFHHQPDLNFDNPRVHEALIEVMDRWFRTGVDGMRLDAVPYLYEREGTSCENLAETHQFLKKLRKHLDEAFPGRMLLAEANQWPEDAAAYFGDGDECHMNFHFPVMPRLFMSLQLENRTPLVDILQQTPEIPPGCQWATFLRNHDELTLEMVTDEERDYMYQAYAADPQMRLNVGIRRRLAPLVENSRRRIELLNMLLFSMPGTPIVYYGDELGMGDNIYLGDRNGVRTPMQWSSDRNGGFSRADTARLFAPPIVDPVYGYQAINVEALERSPFSLLNWMRRLIALRRQHRVFGRGSIEFVPCSNRKVLAYLRRDAGETVLVLANLSRSLQPVDLDLSPYAGLIPIEMLGLTEFPRIAPDKPSFFTLGPYAAHWFSLAAQPMQVTQTMSEPEQTAAPPLAADLPALLIGVNWETLLDSATRIVLERQALVPFITRQRWFASKSRVVRDARFADWVMLRGGATPAFVTIATVSYAEGEPESYVVPLALAVGDQANRAIAETPGSVLARITGARKGAIIDGLLDDDVCNMLADMSGQETKLESRRGSVQGLRVAGLELAGERKWTRPAAESSNTVVFVNDQYVLKIFRRLESGPNPEFEVGQALTEVGFSRVPTLASALLYQRAGSEAAAVGVVQAAVTNQGSGWSFTIDELRRYYERVDARIARPDGEPMTAPADVSADTDGSEPPPFFAALEGWYLGTAATLGRRTAELHLALASIPGAAFAPEPFDAEALEAFASAAAAHAGTMLDLLASRRDTLPDDARENADAVLGAKSLLLERLRAIHHMPHAGQRIRVHGDYHLGQVLRTEEDFVILDFEGEPARSLEERRGKYSPLKDVAGMLRSFQYAAYAALFAFTQSSAGTLDRLAPWAAAWHHWVSRAFVGAYRETMGDTPLLPAGERFDEMLQALMLEKALYELGYELNSRPEWARIPLRALVALASPLQR